MAYSVLNLKTDLENSLHGTTLNRIAGINSLIYRAASDLLLQLDPMETKRIVLLPNPIYDKVFDYAVPSDLKGNKIIDIRPQVDRTILDKYTQIYNQDFDLNKDYVLQPDFTIQHNSGVKTIRINQPLINTGLILNQCDGLTANGTWTAGGSASGLAMDNLNYVSGSASLSFNLAAAGSQGYLVNSTFTAQDLTNHYNQGSVFFYVYLPTATNFNSVVLQWGSSATNYWTQTLTTNHPGNSFNDGWNLLRADWKSATIINSPDKTKVNYLKILYNYNGTAMTMCRLDNIVSRLGMLIEMEYYSKYIFRDYTTGAFQETITDDTNLINLDTDTRNLLYLLCGVYSVQQIQGLDALYYDGNFFAQKYEEALGKYKQMYKSEVQKPKSTYYKLPNSNYRRFFGKRYNY